VISFLSSLLFANSKDGGSVGRGNAKIGSPHPPMVCEGIAPSAAAAAVDISTAMAEYLNINAIATLSQNRATRRKHTFAWGRPYI
jgi:hypothetical protein